MAVDDPCKVLTKAELAARLNVAPGAPASLGPRSPNDPPPIRLPGARYCQFVSGSTVAFVGLVSDYAPQTYAKYKQETRPADKVGPAPVEGLVKEGEAVWDPNGNGMVVLVGDKILALQVVTPLGDRHNWHRRLRLLADKGLERL